MPTSSSKDNLAQLVSLLGSDDPDGSSFGEGTSAEIAALTDTIIQSGQRELMPSLEAHLEAFLEQADFYGRDVIGQVLAGIAGADALRPLLRASARDLGDDQDSFQATICGLIEDNPEQARPAILELIEANDGASRATGFWALDYILEDRDLPILLAALGDSDPKVRAAVVSPVGQLAARITQATDALCAMLADSDAQVRISSLSALGHAGRRSSVPSIIALGSDSDARVRAWVAISLGQLGDNSALPTLVRLETDRDPFVQQQAQQAHAALTR